MPPDKVFRQELLEFLLKFSALSKNWEILTFILQSFTVQNLLSIGRFKDLGPKIDQSYKNEAKESLWISHCEVRVALTRVSIYQQA